MKTQDIQWIQRFKHFSKALSQLTRFIKKVSLNEMEKQGLIQSFEYTYELAWNTLKDYFESQGETIINGSLDAFLLAFRRGIIEDDETWMEMIKRRALTVHTYDKEIAEKITSNIINRYYPEFKALAKKMDSLSDRVT